MQTKSVGAIPITALTHAALPAFAARRAVAQQVARLNAVRKISGIARKHHIAACAAWVLLAAFTVAARAQFVIEPAIYNVTDAASYTSGIAQGGLFIVWGYRICPEGLHTSPAPYQETFNGVTVTLRPTEGGNAVRAFIVYTYDGTYEQIAAVLPSSVAAGVYDVIVTNGTETITGLGKARVVPRKYRSFANNQQGYGLAVVQNYVDASRLDRNMFVAGTIGGLTKGPARPGQTVTLWGLGLGGISKPDNEGPGALDLRSSLDIRIAVGGVEAQVLYAGRSPEFPGVDQINFTLPPDAPTGCNLALEVIVDGSASNPVTIAIAPPGESSCHHPFLTPEQLEKLDQGEQLLAGEFNMMVYREQDFSRSGLPYVEANSAVGSFSFMDASRASMVNLDSIPVGRCVSWHSDDLDIRIWGETTGLLLDAFYGDSADAGGVSLTGPNFSEAPLDDDDDWYYGFFSVRRMSDGQQLSGDPQYAYTPGEYTLRGAGGYHLKDFEAKLQVPDFLTWENIDSIQTIDRNSPPEIRWTGGGDSDKVLVQGVSVEVTGGSPTSPELDVGTFMCALPGTSRSFVLPTSVLKLLPWEDGFSGATITVSSFADLSRAAFTAELTEEAADLGVGSELGMGVFGHLVMTTKLVSYR